MGVRTVGDSVGARIGDFLHRSSQQRGRLAGVSFVDFACLKHAQVLRTPKEEELPDDTDAESVSSQDSVDTDVDTDATEVEPGKDIVEPDDEAATGAEQPQAQSAATGALRKPPLWTDQYFYIADNEGQPDVKIRMYSARLIWPRRRLNAPFGSRSEPSDRVTVRTLFERHIMRHA